VSQLLRHSPDVVYRDLADGDGGVLLHLQSADYLRVNATGAHVWRAVDGARDEAAVVVEVRQQLPDAPGRLEDDVSAFIDELRRRGLLLEGSP
jgi:hypothetical protein